MSRAGEKLFASPEGSGIPLRQSYAQVGEIALILFSHSLTKGHPCSHNIDRCRGCPGATLVVAVMVAAGGAGCQFRKCLNRPLLADHGSVPQFNHSLCAVLVYCKNLTFIPTRLYDHVLITKHLYETLIHFGIHCIGV